MYTHIGLGIVALAVIFTIPISEESTSDSAHMYGFVTLALNDAAGIPVFEQIIHNQIVDKGEDYMLAQSFNNGTGGTTSFQEVENDLIDAICVTVEANFVALENENATGFNANSGATNLNCESVVFTISGSQASTPATLFNATGGTSQNVASGGVTITGIVICSNEGKTSDADAFADCSVADASTAPVIATVNTADVTLGTSDTVSITYTLTLD